MLLFFFQLNNRIPSKQALCLLTLGEMGGAQDEALGAQDSQGETQHDLTLSLPRGRLALDRVKYIKSLLGVKGLREINQFNT